MILPQFLNCLSYFGIDTGVPNALEGVYNFQSGDSTLIYNLLYSPSESYVNGVVNSTVLPLVSVGHNGNSGNLTGTSSYHLGYQNTNNFEVLVDISYSGCVKNQTYGTDYVLVSTVQNASGYASGFIVGINDSNRLFFQTSGFQYTLGYELKPRNFVFVSLANNQFVNFGIFDISQNALSFETVDVGSPILQTYDLYIGGFLNNTNPSYTGFVGTINQVIAFQDIISTDDIQTCINCSFATGITTGTTNNLVTGIQITGGIVSGEASTSITGYLLATGYLLTSSGASINIIYESGIESQIIINQTLYPLYKESVINISGENINVMYDSVALSQFATSNLCFQVPFYSGDSVEIYTYPTFNPNNNLRIDGSTWPTNTGFIQLISNGVTETMDLDYAVLRNQISGFGPDTDIISYDALSTQPVVIFFSGLYQDLVNNGLSFSPIPNFNEQMADYLPQAIYLTGVPGVCIGNPNWPNFDLDVYLNGQKLVSGYQYQVSTSGVSGFVVAVSGNAMLELYTQLVYVPESGYYLEQVKDLSSSEMTFVPQYAEFQYTYLSMTGQTNYINNVTGFSESIWINGLRQVKNVDYIKQYPCMLVSGFFNPPNLTFPLFNNNISQFNQFP